MTNCSHINSSCINSRHAIIDEIPTIRRRRICDDCGERFSTIEVRCNSYMKATNLTLRVLSDERIDEIMLLCDQIKESIQDRKRQVLH